MGLSFKEEQHGDGPVHWASQVEDSVLEIYPQVAVNPPKVIEQITDKELLSEMLRGSYSPKGVKQWFEHSQSWIEGATPQEVLDSGDADRIKMLKDHCTSLMRGDYY